MDLKPLGEDIKKLVEEIRVAEDFRDKHITLCDQMLRRYVGNYYSLNVSSTDQPENAAFEFVATMIPAIVYDNPKVNLTGYGDSPEHYAMAAFMEPAMNLWIRRVRLKQILERVCLDSFFSYGVTLTTLRDDFDYMSPAMRKKVAEEASLPDTVNTLVPFVHRISPRKFFVDSAATCIREARFMGHEFTMTVGQALSFDFDRETIIKAAKSYVDDKDKNPFRDKAGEIERMFVKLYSVYVRDEIDPSKGKVYVIAKGLNVEESGALRVSEYFGSANGPYRMWGFYSVPDSIFPLSPMAVQEELLREINAHATTAAKAAANYKKFVIYDAANSELGTVLKDSVSGGVYGVRGATQQHAVVELGGAGPNSMDHLIYLRGRLDRLSGLSDAQRGEIDSTATATAIQLASQGSSLRLQWMQGKFADATADLLSDVGFYILNNEHFDVKLVKSIEKSEKKSKGDRNVEERAFENISFEPMEEEERPVEWDDFGLQIEPYSMQRSNENAQQAKIRDAVTQVVNLASAAAQGVPIDVKAVLATYGDAINVPEMVNWYLDGQTQPGAGNPLIQSQMIQQAKPTLSGFKPVPLPQIGSARNQASGSMRSNAAQQKKESGVRQNGRA